MAGPRAGGGGPSQFPKEYAARQALNREATIYFAAAMAGLIGIVTIFHLIRVVGRRGSLASAPTVLASPFFYTSRVLRNVLIRKVPGLPSAGHAGLAVAYVTLNIVLTFTHLLDDPVMSLKSNVAARTGWLSLANICLAIFLGMKNTPLGFLTTWSYERLNSIHQVVGYTTMALVIIHAAAYTDYFADSGNWARLRVIDEIYGIVAGFTMLTLVVVGFTIRRRYYELFYLIHVSFFVLSMVFIGLHQPDIPKQIFAITAAGAGIWVFDRIVRIFRVTWYSFNNKATVHPLPHGGTRIVLRKPPKGARSGEHCFLWIPKIRLLEMHPFTIAAMDPLEFVIASYDGFTSDLHKFAKANPGATIRASVEGSYGSFPDPAAYDKVVLIAGGSGASFTVGMALNMLKRLKPRSQQRIEFVWMVKDCDHFDWFSGHLSTIRHTLNGSISLFVTRSPQPNMTMTSTTLAQVDLPNSAASYTPDSAPGSPIDLEEKYPLPLERPAGAFFRHVSDPEKSGAETDFSSPVSALSVAAGQSHLHGIPITYGRPDVSEIVKKAIDGTPVNQRVLVMCCGPDGLTTEVRNTTARNISRKGPAVELHCEQFGW
ncbi:ferric reductase like transmembrane component [Sodiomyces alkalinus F11]|uniref:Ferric reductase like transmembrane component n=1 Tax=Sodiomyces alkalinus (strain CBS 110278 / VKM F-3762 / F11) TaxID=1314773 RepID=A0A3N2PM89_SODAK|nr:ferric reductase like transmembrane component [Sodiomyces alkalinus F11]ROT35633.1 ferric reductase like transmembrane component [Sodiomyces alkalinus F11]